MEMRTFILRSRSGLHCGIGQGLSDIDLPTAKEAVSGYPFVPGSSIKGVLRDLFDGQTDPDNAQKFLAAFGRPSQDGGPDFASALSFGDARLICLPVRSYFGTFAYLSSPYSLNILKDILERARSEGLPAFPDFPRETNTYRCVVTSGSKLVPHTRDDRILLEDLDLLIQGNSTLADSWAEIISNLLFPGEDEHSQQGKRMFLERFVIVDDDVMSFLCETALPVATRIRIGENGVVLQGALWLEEFVPPEAIFAGTVFGENGAGEYSDLTASELLDFVCADPIDCQLGGHATVGRGLVSIRFS